MKELGVEDASIFVAPDQITGKLILGFEAELVPEEDGSELPLLLTEVCKRLVGSRAIPPITPLPPFHATWHSDGD